MCEPSAAQNNAVIRNRTSGVFVVRAQAGWMPLSRAWQGMASIARVQRFGVGKAHACENGETKRRLSTWKQTIPRNHWFGTTNDLNGLRPAMRNASFRLAKDSFRFRCFWASSTPETKRRREPHASRRGAKHRVSKEDPEAASWTVLRDASLAPSGQGLWKGDRRREKVALKRS